MSVVALLEIWLTALPWVALWAAAAAGYGRLLRPLLPARTDDAPTGAAAPPRVLQLTLGAALLLVIDAAAGRLGLLALGGGAGAWVLTAGGVLLLLDQLRRRSGPPVDVRPHALWLTALPAAGVLLVAAASAPGWLWASEFGGYDALSYHLLLPREWSVLGASGGLEHNVYSYLPSYMETAFLHLVHLRGDAVAAAPACQMLHAGFALLTAGLVACAVTRGTDRATGAIAGVLVLGTPWVVVTGSLAYDEMAACAFLAAGWIRIDASGADGPDARTGAAVGLLAAAACGAKLTAVGVVALPLALLLALRPGAPGRRIAALAVAAAAGGAGLLPWVLGNALDTGNPFFPFLTDMLGSGHWTADQAARFAGGHGAGLGAAARCAAGWEQFGRYGIGPSPGAGEPWAPLWSALPWLALAGAVLAAGRAPLRGTAVRLILVVLVQIVFWLACTHVKSRFMLPFVVPGAMLVALGAAALVRVPPRAPTGRAAGTRTPTLVAAGASVLLLGWCALPVALFARERGGHPTAAIGGIDAFDGDLHAALIGAAPGAPERAALRAEAPPAYWINHELDIGARVLGVGTAAVFYIRPERIAYATVWDRGPLTRALDDDARTRSAGTPGAETSDAALAAALVTALETAARNGFTHLIVDETMLRNWQERGWSDPRLDPEAILRAADGFANVLHRFPGGVHLYTLPAPAGP